MVVGCNCNKIYVVVVVCFWVIVWVIVFIFFYFYYIVNLGFKIGFVYIGLCFVSWVYVYFCVGEVIGRIMEEIDGFFCDGILVKKWKY